MRCTRFIGTVLMLLGGVSVAAEIVTYEYTGTINSVFGPAFNHYEVGDQISGQIVIDTESGVADEYSTPAYNFFSDVQLSATLGDLRSDTSTGRITFVDAIDIDRFSISGRFLDQGNWQFLLYASYSQWNENPEEPGLELGQDGVAPGSRNLVFTIAGDLALLGPESFFFQQGSPAGTGIRWTDFAGESKLEAAWNSFVPMPDPASNDVKRSFVLRFINLLGTD